MSRENNHDSIGNRWDDTRPEVAFEEWYKIIWKARVQWHLQRKEQVLRRGLRGGSSVQVSGLKYAVESNRSSGNWSTYHHCQWNIEWLLKGEKKPNLAPTHQKHILDAADYFRRVIREIPRIQSAYNGSRCEKPTGAHGGAFEFNSSLGWEILSNRGFLLDLIRYQPSPYTHWSGRWNQDIIVILTTRSGKSTYQYIYMIATILVTCWKTPPWFRKNSQDPTLAIVLNMFFVNCVRCILVIYQLARVNRKLN